jgi:tetratricopeptide (TPR) repeat protein
MVSEAEMWEIQQKYDESRAAYEKLLTRDDVPAVMRAAANNNLAYLLALSGQDPDRALEAVNQAIEVIGPISDILDTRALVYLARGENDKAVEDMQLSIKVGPTPSKYFHLVWALLAAGKDDAARDAWKKAQEAGLTPAPASKLEEKPFEDVQKKIQSLGGVAAL